MVPAGYQWDKPIRTHAVGEHFSIAVFGVALLFGVGLPMLQPSFNGGMSQPHIV
jgi:hypothetical protein